MRTEAGHTLGAMFLVALCLSWAVVTTLIAMAIWTDRSSSLLRSATWVSLWVFTVVVPTLNAMTVHRAVQALKHGDADPELQTTLIRLRPFLLLSANMALLSAFALILGR